MPKTTVDWNSVLYDEFCEIAMLNDTEKKILRGRIMGITVKEMSVIYDMSESSIHGMVDKLRKKYDICQKYSTVLPKRRMSKEEQYMDDN